LLNNRRSLARQKTKPLLGAAAMTISTEEMVIPMHYEPDYSRTQIHFLTQPPEWLAHLEKIGNPRVILDLGSGGGRNSVYLRTQFREAYVVALDLSFIRSVSCRQATGADVVCGDAMRLPFPDDLFDMVLSTQVIEHVPDDWAFVKEASRIVKKGGRMLITSVLRLPHGWYFYRHQGRWVLDPTHVREYRSREQFLALFSDGFRLLDSAVEPIHFSPAHFVYRLLARTGLVSNPDPSFFSRTALAGSLGRWGLLIPGYRTITAVVQKG
jgi:SAM-dependent methyltransferase